ncbi:hypothetical protein INS49_007410 [Diaporthe citri]|uniref:uncharacterized protein n=1 Tax=Diaporthe citri TaxID=83186 RepID=UPI001C8085AF|nr:uncharacterized protein INS49_007410 [Diaporthe citri]KAG6365799.1 hypothetical protein INS49_007410 [Diaporthe citri]
MSSFIPTAQLRLDFAKALSRMYSQEVPQYATLQTLVDRVNDSSDANIPLTEVPRHGAVRLASLSELSVAAKFFKVLGMVSVGYYDLSAAGLPIHATAFRPITQEGLSIAPFRLFVSVLRPELLTESLQPLARSLLSKRSSVFSQRTIDLADLAALKGGLTAAEADEFIRGGCETLAWRNQVALTKQDYDTLKADKNGDLLIDIMAFRNPHLNHLTPATKNIDAVQRGMLEVSLEPKDRVEGPPERDSNVLLRQTSFLAVDEGIVFDQAADKGMRGSHSARFGEIEQRGAALTRKGRKQYDEAISEATRSRLLVDGKEPAFKALFDKALPDDWETLRSAGLIWVEYSLTEKGEKQGKSSGVKTLQDAVVKGLVGWQAIQYEDFLPLSAAGIFQSNLHHDSEVRLQVSPQNALSESKRQLREVLGDEGMMDEMKLYEEQQATSIAICCEALGISAWDL